MTLFLRTYMENRRALLQSSARAKCKRKRIWSPYPTVVPPHLTLSSVGSFRWTSRWVQAQDLVSILWEGI